MFRRTTKTGRLQLLLPHVRRSQISRVLQPRQHLNRKPPSVPSVHTPKHRNATEKTIPPPPLTKRSHHVSIRNKNRRTRTTSVRPWYLDVAFPSLRMQRRRNQERRRRVSREVDVDRPREFATEIAGIVNVDLASDAYHRRYGG